MYWSTADEGRKRWFLRADVALFSPAVFAIDTSALLYGIEERPEGYIDYLESLGDDLVVPATVRCEFERKIDGNLAREIERATIHVISKFQLSPAARRFKNRGGVDRAALDKAFAVLAEEAERSIRSDAERLRALVAQRALPPLSAREYDELRDEARERFARKQGPGYIDYERDRCGESAFNDYFIFAELMRHRFPAGHVVAMITKEHKSDWWVVQDRQPAHVREDMAGEFRAKTGHRFVLVLAQKVQDAAAAAKRRRDASWAMSLALAKVTDDSAFRALTALPPLSTLSRIDMIVSSRVWPSLTSDLAVRALQSPRHLRLLTSHIDTSLAARLAVGTSFSPPTDILMKTWQYSVSFPKFSSGLLATPTTQFVDHGFARSRLAGIGAVSEFVSMRNVASEMFGRLGHEGRLASALLPSYHTTLASEALRGRATFLEQAALRALDHQAPCGSWSRFLRLMNELERKRLGPSLRECEYRRLHKAALRRARRARRRRRRRAATVSPMKGRDKELAAA